MKTMVQEFGLKWVHMGQYGVILRLDGAMWHTIIFRPLLTQKGPTMRLMYTGTVITKIVSLGTIDLHPDLVLKGRSCPSQRWPGYAEGGDVDDLERGLFRRRRCYLIFDDVQGECLGFSLPY